MEEYKLAQVTQESQKFRSRAEGEKEQGTSLMKRLLKTKDDLAKEVKDASKQRKNLQRTQRRWHSTIEQFLCLLFGSNFEYQSQLLRQSSGVSELILDIKNLLRTKTMFGPSSAPTNNLPAVGAPAILIGENNAMLAFAVIEQTVAEIMPAFIDSMHSNELNDVIRGAAMNKFGIRAPSVGRQATALETAAAARRYDVVAPELDDVNPDQETLDRARQQAIAAADESADQASPSATTQKTPTTNYDSVVATVYVVNFLFVLFVG